MLKFMQYYIRIMRIVMAGGISFIILICCCRIFREGLERGMLGIFLMAAGMLVYSEVLFRYLNKIIWQISISGAGIELASLHGERICLAPSDIQRIKLNLITYKILVKKEEQQRKEYKCFLNVTVVKFGKKHKGIQAEDFPYADMEQ